MSHPWEVRAAEGAGTPTPTNRAFLAMRKAGLKPVAIDDESQPGRWVGTRITFACGCVRRYRADQRTRVETETVDPCEDHGNLLTGLGLSGSVLGVGGKVRQQQESNPDDHHDSP